MLPSRFSPAELFGVSLYFAIVFSPTVLLPWLWLQLRITPVSLLPRSLAAITTLSHTHLLLGFIWKSTLLGPDYSPRLYATVQFHTAVNLLAAVAAISIPSPVRLQLTLSTLACVLSWFFVWAINTAL